MRFTRLALVALCCCLVGLAGIAIVAGAPPPTQLCGVCTDDPTGEPETEPEAGPEPEREINGPTGVGTAGATEPGIDGAIEPGTLDVYVDENGDSLWSARVPVTDSAAERYRTDETALESAVDDAWARYHAAEGDVRAVESTLEDETVVVNYTVDDVAREGVGDAWLLDYFATGRSTTRYQLAAQRVTIHTPDGTAVTNRPAYATVDGNTVAWTAGAEGRFESDFDDRTYVTYGPDGLRGTASSYATIAREIGPTALEEGVVGSIVPATLIVFAGLTVGRVGWGRSAFDLETLERSLVAVGSVGAIGLLVVSAVSTGRPFAPGFGALSALGVGYASLAVVARRTGYRRSLRGVIRTAVLVALGTGALLWVLGGRVSMLVFPVALATALFLPIGYVGNCGSRMRVSLFVTTLPVGVMTAVAVGLFLFTWPVGFGIVFYRLILAFWAAVIVVFGYPLGLLGRHLAATEPQ